MYGVAGAVEHGGAALLPVHARGRTHPGGHLWGQAGAHVGAHAGGAVWPRPHLPGAHAAGGHAGVGRSAALARHGVHGATDAGASRVVGVGHVAVAGLPGVAWRRGGSVRKSIRCFY